ncbi:MAG: hypothetical protein B0W54_10630 [Cellvibrio sp. 79]|nr:MAG: hypothetical protein B0W54_10630 [Cellvibrio sp. 79]
MIQFSHEKEKEILLHYAKKLNKPLIEQIINSGHVSSSQEASALSKFFWEMVDAIVEDKKSSAVVEGQTDLEAWNEYVFESIRAHLRNNGYTKEWDDQV